MFSRVAGYDKLEDNVSKKGKNAKMLCLALAGIIAYSLFHFIDFTSSTGNLPELSKEPLCPIAAKYPVVDKEKVEFILNDENFRNNSAALLGKSLQIDTVVYDTMTMEDYFKFEKFHKFLQSSFPLVYKNAKVHTINTYGLVFEFKGSNESLKPIMLAAHQDTVPIGDPKSWTMDPWSGSYDGEKVYGRGAADCKNLLVGLMESMEELLNDGKTSLERGVLLAFGFDEEKSGFDGARKIGQYLETYLGYDSVEFLIDEGISMFTEQMGDYYGLLLSGEKGYLDLTVEVTTPGGHSSVPNDHTSIGMLSFFLTHYEFDQFSAVLPDENPMLSMFECAAEHGHIPANLAYAAKHARSDEKYRKALTEFLSNGPNPMLKYTVKTSQAIDIVDGGDKANSLPRSVLATINHRIAYGDSFDTVVAKAKKHALSTAETFGIGLTIFDEVIIPEGDSGNMIISNIGEYLRTANPSPVSGDVWNSIAGSMRSFYEDVVYPEKFTGESDKKYIIAPAIMSANTDTRHYWNLTSNIYKGSPGYVDLFQAGAHGIDENIEIESHLQIVAFYYDFISKYCGAK
ncbi:hypothetical protein DAMA08_022210 [Martiniozyma asiatica (nom. inval.)]|nr:hypothetical protein DAMA08_022210 [Martiniozyma asiatica]